MFLKTEEFECFACAFCQTPSPIRVLPLIQEGELFFTLLFNMLLKLLLLDKRRWPSGRRSLNFCLRVQSNSLPLRVLPLIQEGELFITLLFNMLPKLLLLDKRRWPSSRRSLNFCLRVQSNSLPLRVLPLIQEGELFSLCYSKCY